jgi:hypothetical protein
MSSPLRYAGIWNATTLYYLNNMVVSPINNSAYALSLSSLTGGSDPSASADWELVPNGSAVAGVSSLETLTGAITLSSSDATFTPNGQDIVMGITFPTLPHGIYTEPTGGNTNVVIPIIGLTSTGLVSICYVHAGGGGGAQYTKSITNTTDQCSLIFNTAGDIGDTIIWQVLQLA